MREIMTDTFQAIVLRQSDKDVVASIEMISEDALPAGDVTVVISYSSLNYKDGMILNGLGRLVRAYPHVPGVDFAGTVEKSDSPRFVKGDEVILTGWRVGEIRWGGYAKKARVRADWLVKRPPTLSPLQAMALGSAGLTAMLALMELEGRGLSPSQDGEVLVTGAAGGVGSVAVALLSDLGYKVAASTGRLNEIDFLKSLGAQAIVPRSELAAPQEKPLLSERWNGCVDVVGGQVLASAMAAMKYGTALAACGLAGSTALMGTVLPLLLRRVSIIGIDSVMIPTTVRTSAWDRLAWELDLKKLEAITTVVPLGDVIDEGRKILEGNVRGRIVVDTGTSN